MILNVKYEIKIVKNNIFVSCNLEIYFLFLYNINV